MIIRTEVGPKQRGWKSGKIKGRWTRSKNKVSLKRCLFQFQIWIENVEMSGKMFEHHVQNESLFHSNLIYPFSFTFFLFSEWKHCFANVRSRLDAHARRHVAKLSELSLFKQEHHHGHLSSMGWITSNSIWRSNILDFKWMWHFPCPIVQCLPSSLTVKLQRNKSQTKFTRAIYFANINKRKLKLYSNLSLARSSPLDPWFSRVLSLIVNYPFKLPIVKKSLSLIQTVQSRKASNNFQ